MGDWGLRIAQSLIPNPFLEVLRPGIRLDGQGLSFGCIENTQVSAETFRRVGQVRVYNSGKADVAADRAIIGFHLAGAWHSSRELPASRVFATYNVYHSEQHG